MRSSKGNDSRKNLRQRAANGSRSRAVPRKHRREADSAGVLHLYLRESGWWQQRRVADPRRLVPSIVESLQSEPAAPWTYVLLLVSYLPMQSLDFAARCKHQRHEMAEVRSYLRPDAGVSPVPDSSGPI